MEESEKKLTREPSVMGNETIEAYLVETAKWGKFLAILGYIMMGIWVLFAFFMMFGMSELSKLATGHNFPGIGFGLIYLILAGVYFVPITYLYRFSVLAQKAVLQNNEESYTFAFQNLKSLFKFTGIFTIVGLVICGLLLAVATPLALLLK